MKTTIGKREQKRLDHIQTEKDEIAAESPIS